MSKLADFYRDALAIGLNPAYMPRKILIRASGDTTGVKDNAALDAAYAKITAAGAGIVEIGEGDFYFARAMDGSNNQTSRLVPANSITRGAGKKATRLHFVSDGVTTNQQGSLLLATGVDNWQVEDLTLDYGYPFDPQQTPAFNQSDSGFNNIRVTLSNNWMVRNCAIMNAGFHGIHGAGAVNNVRILDNDFIRNGNRAFHIHAQSSAINTSIIVKGNRLYKNGRGTLRTYVCRANTTSGASAVTLSSADYTALKSINTLAGVSPIMVVAGAGANGGDFIDLVSTFTDGTTSVSSGRNLGTTLTGTQVTFYHYVNAGIFVNFGGSETVIEDNLIYGENGSGIEIESWAEPTRVVDFTSNAFAASVSSNVSATTNKLSFSPTDYTAMKTAFNSVGAANAMLQVYRAGADGIDVRDYGGLSVTFDDTNMQITFTAGNVAFVVSPGYVFKIMHSVASGGTYVARSNKVVVKNNIIKDCVYGIVVGGSDNIEMDNIIDGSKLSGIWLLGCNNVTIKGQITNSAVSHIYGKHGSGLASSNINVDAMLDGSGASGILFNIAGAAGAVTGLSVSPQTRILNSGQNLNFASTNHLFTAVSNFGVQLTSDGTAPYSDINLSGTYKYNLGGSVSGQKVQRALVHNAVFEDNCPAAGGATTEVAFSVSSNDVTVEHCRFWNVGRINSYLTFSVNDSCANATFRYNKTNFNRNGSLGNIGTFGGATLAASNLWYGNDLPSGCVVQYGSNVAPNLVAGFPTGRGVGGAVTQATSRTTGVTLNKATGTITGNAASLAASTAATFTVTNSTVAAGDTVNLSVQSGAPVTTLFSVSAVAAGSFNITANNVSTTTADTSAPVINFTVTKGSST